MSDLKRTIEGLAAEFATNIIGALRGASIDELLSVSGGGARKGGRPGRPAAAAASEVGGRKRGRGGRLGRRSATDIARMVDSIAAVLQQHPEGLRAEQIREQLAVQSKELPRPLADALSQGRISKKGQKRATTYFIADGGAASGGTKARGRRRKRSS